MKLYGIIHYTIKFYLFTRREALPRSGIEEGKKEILMEDKQRYNRKINKLYRQLGKDIYDQKKDINLNHKHKKLIKLIDHNIMLANKSEDDEKDIVKLPGDAIVLEPKANEDGLIVYFFCPYCHTGNNPDSTHCIKCNRSLK